MHGSRMSVLLFVIMTVTSSLAIKHFIHYEIKNLEKSPEEVRGEMKDTDVLYSFKDLGAPNYEMVLEVTPRNFLKLQDVSLTGIVKQTPVVDMVDIGKVLNVTWPRCGKILPDANLTLIERRFPLKGLTTAEAKAHMKAYMEEMKKPLQKYNYKAFYSESYIPPSMFLYVNMPLDDVNDLAFKGINQFGGPGSVNTTVKFIHNNPSISQ